MLEMNITEKIPTKMVNQIYGIETMMVQMTQETQITTDVQTNGKLEEMKSGQMKTKQAIEHGIQIKMENQMHGIQMEMAKQIVLMETRTIN